MYLCIPIPFAALGKTEVFLAARLACLIHAANVHSEPGSNPSILYALTALPEGKAGHEQLKTDG